MDVIAHVTTHVELDGKDVMEHHLDEVISALTHHEVLESLTHVISESKQVVEASSGGKSVDWMVVVNVLKSLALSSKKIPRQVISLPQDVGTPHDCDQEVNGF